MSQGRPWFDPALLGRVVDLGTVEVTAAQVAAYCVAVGDERGAAVVPPTFCLIMRRGMTPEIDLPPGTFGVYGGHDLEFAAAIEIGRTYHSRGWINDIFEKSGRSGALTVVERTAEICDAGDVPVARIVERQIVRAPATAVSARDVDVPASHGAIAASPAPPSRRPHDRVEIGDDLQPWRRRGASAAEVARYIGSGEMREPLFSDVDYARALGFRGIVVPGPMLTAFLEQFLWRELPGYRLERLGTTFRQPTISGDDLTLRGAVVEHHREADAERIVCDLVIEHGNGERAVTGGATLRRLEVES